MYQPAPEGVRAALREAVVDFGPKILDNPRMMENLLADLLPDSPRERDILIAAAEAGTAATLHEYIDEQRIEPATAVHMVASSLNARTGAEPDMCSWVAVEYARAIGHPITVPVAPLPKSQEIPQEAQTDTQQPEVCALPPATRGPRRHGPLGKAKPGGGPRTMHRGLVLSVVAAVGVVGLGGWGAYALLGDPPATTTSLDAHLLSPAPPSAQPTPAPSSLRQVMPSDISDTGCTDKTASTKARLAGLQTRLLCTTYDTPGIQVDAFQFDNEGHYKQALQAINVALNYKESEVTADCPPAPNPQGKTDWWSETNPTYAKKPGQFIECFYNPKDKSYNYLYTMPTSNALMWAFTGTGWPALDNWWKRYAVPSASPMTGRTDADDG